MQRRKQRTVRCPTTRAVETDTTVFLPWSSPLARRLPPVGFQTCASPPTQRRPSSSTHRPLFHFRWEFQETLATSDPLRVPSELSTERRESSSWVDRVRSYLPPPFRRVSSPLFSRFSWTDNAHVACFQPPRPRLVPRGSTPSEFEEVTSSTEPSDSTLETSLGDLSTLPRRSESSVLCVSSSMCLGR